MIAPLNVDVVTISCSARPSMISLVTILKNRRESQAIITYYTYSKISERSTLITGKKHNRKKLILGERLDHKGPDLTKMIDPLR